MCWASRERPSKCQCHLQMSKNRMPILRSEFLARFGHFTVRYGPFLNPLQRSEKLAVHSSPISLAQVRLVWSENILRPRVENKIPGYSCALQSLGICTRSLVACTQKCSGVHLGTVDFKELARFVLFALALAKCALLVHARGDKLSGIDHLSVEPTHESPLPSPLCFGSQSGPPKKWKRRSSEMHLTFRPKPPKTLGAMFSSISVEIWILPRLLFGGSRVWGYFLNVIAKPIWLPCKGEILI